MAKRERRIAGVRELLALIREDLRVNGGILLPGFQALAVYRFGVWKDGIAAKPLRIPFTIVYRLAYAFVRNFYGIELPVSARIGRRLWVGHQHGIIVHPNAVIGDDCLIRQGVSIGQAAGTRGVWVGHARAPKLGDRVEVGVNAVIFGAITVGDGVRIGPNAVVMTNVPAGAIVTAPLSRVMLPPKRKPVPAAGSGARPAASPSGPRPAARRAPPNGRPAHEPQRHPDRPGRARGDRPGASGGAALRRRRRCLRGRRRDERAARGRAGAEARPLQPRGRPAGGGRRGARRDRREQHELPDLGRGGGAHRPLPEETWPGLRHRLRAGLVGTWTTNTFAPLLRLAAARHGIALDIDQPPFGQYFNATLDPGSELLAAAPDVLVLAPDQRALGLRPWSDTPAEDVAAELDRWTGVWEALRRARRRRSSSSASPRPAATRSATTAPAIRGRGRASSPRSTPGSRRGRRRRTSASSTSRCSRRARARRAWFDPRGWYMAKLPYGPAALPVLARHVAAVLAARLGLSRRALVLDLDNTLWGGVIGDDGLGGIVLGQGAEGEAFVDFQAGAEGALGPRHRARGRLEERPRGGAAAVPRAPRDAA